MNRTDLTTDRQDPRRPNEPADPIRPLPNDEPPEEWDEEVIEDLPEEEQREPVPPS